MQEIRKVSRLKMERLTRGWSIEQVANMIGASRSAVCDWEAERKTPSVSAAIRLSKLYRVQIEDLFHA